MNIFHFVMSSNHLGAAFNHSCLKVPVNPANLLPNPSYERKPVSNSIRDVYNNIERTRRKSINFEDRVQCLSAINGSSVSKDGSSLQTRSSTPCQNMNENISKDSFQSFLSFYDSIPDYGDVIHLSDRDFYMKLQFIKARHLSYLTHLKGRSYYESEATPNGKKERLLSAESMISSGTNGTKLSNPIVSRNYTNLEFTSKEPLLDDKNREMIHQGYIAKTRHNSDLFNNSLSWNRNLSKVAIVSPSPETSLASVDHLVKRNPHQHTKNPSIQINNYISDVGGEGGRNEVATKKRLCESKLKGKRLLEPTAKPGMEEGSSVLDSFWDGLSVDDSHLDSPCTRSLPNSPGLKLNKNVMWKKPNITVPNPFKMTVREEENRYLDSLRSLLPPGERMSTFRAKPVPLTSRLPLYDKIQLEQELRSLCVRNKRSARLQAESRPFSFAWRDEVRRFAGLCSSTPELSCHAEDNPHPFRARPVPRNLFSNYMYQRMREEEFYRALKKRIRAEELLKASSLPPSMAARERLAKARSKSLELLDEDTTPRRHYRKIPDFTTSQERMRRQLESRCSQNITVSPRAFRLETARLGSKKSKVFSPDLRPRSALGLPLNRNNLASVLRIQSSRQRLERDLEAKQDELRRHDTAQCRAKHSRQKPAWRRLHYSTAEDLAMRVQTRREEERIRKEEHEHHMELMLDRVDRIPTLFERQSQVPIKRKSKPRGRKEHRSTLPLPETPDLYPDDLNGSVNSCSRTPDPYEESEDAEELVDRSYKPRVSINETTETIQTGGDEDDKETVCVKDEEDVESIPEEDNYKDCETAES